MKRGESLTQPMQLKPLTDWLVPAGLSSFVLAMSTIQSRPETEALEDAEKVSVRLAGGSGEDESGVRAACTAGFQKFHQDIGDCDGPFFPVLGAEAEVQLFGHCKQLGLEVHVANCTS